MSTWQPPKFNTKVHEPTLTDVLMQYKRDALLETNCHGMATVVSFNPNDTSMVPPRPSVVCRLNYPRTGFLPGSATDTQPQIIQFLPLVSVPLVILSGGGGGNSGGASLTFPVVTGDQVFLLYNDRSLNNWKLGSVGPGTPLDSNRVHDLSDAVALVGFPTFPSASGTTPAYSSTYALLSNGAAQVGVGNGKILISNDPHQVSNLGTIIETQAQALNTVMTALQTFMTATAAATTAAQIATAAATFGSAATTAATSMTTAKNAYSALLE